MPEFFSTLVRSLRPADALDVLVGAIVAYAAITWIRRAQSRFVVVGFGLLVALYLLAQMLEMRLTLTLFQGVVAIAVFATIVVFQEEIRHAFERVALRSRIRIARAPHAHGDLSGTIVRAASVLAEQNRGALVVVAGQTPLGRHVTGGIVLRAVPSEPLLWSIFDPHSPGHDGAVLVEGGTLTKFAVRLPLTTRVQDTSYGTRHAAALSLSELCDAFVVVVSEERGCISVAQGGQLDVVEPKVLADRLGRFLEENAPRTEAPSLGKTLLGGDLRPKLLAVALAIAGWYALTAQDRHLVARTYSVPIVYSGVREDLVFEEPSPRELRITFVGSDRAFRRLDPETLSVVLDVSGSKAETRRVEVGPDLVVHPRALSVQRIDPPKVRIRAVGKARENSPM